jgi:hypothetical protein
MYTYQKPTTEAVSMQQRGQVLTVSQKGQASMPNYDWNFPGEE